MILHDSQSKKEKIIISLFIFTWVSKDLAVNNCGHMIEYAKLIIAEYGGVHACITGKSPR